MSNKDNDGTGEDTLTQAADAEPTSHTSSTWKVLGELDDAGATGVLGHNTAGSGSGIGVEGVTDASNSNATGVRAHAPNGGLGLEAMASGNHAIDARTTGHTAIEAHTDGSDWNALAGFNTATTGWSWGVRGDTDSTNSNAHGGKGYATASSGAGNGVSGTTYGDGDGATGVHGEANASSGTTYGVYGTSASSAGYGIYSDGDSKTSGDHEVTGNVTASGHVEASNGFRGDVGAAAYLSSSQDVTGFSSANVAFDAEEADERGEFDVSTGEFTCAYDGTYHVDVTIRMEAGSINAGNELNLWISRGAVILASNKFIVSSEDTEPSIHLSKTLFGLDQGDVITARLGNPNGGTKTIDGGIGGSTTYLTIHQVG